MANPLAEQYTHTTVDTPLEVEAKALVLTLADRLSELEVGHLSMPFLQGKLGRRLKHLLSHTTIRTRSKCRHAALHLISGKSKEFHGHTKRCGGRRTGGNVS